MVADISELFTEVKNLWKEKKNTIILGRAKDKADAMV